MTIEFEEKDCKTFYNSQQCGIHYGFSNAGKKSTIVLNDGLACSFFAWQFLYPQFKKHFNILWWNYPGHGKSEIPIDRDAVTIPSLVQDLSDLIKHLGIKGDLILMGHSLGVQLCLHYALLYPKNLKAMGLFCGASGSLAETFNNTDFFQKIMPLVRKTTKKPPKMLDFIWNRIMPTELAVDIGTTIGQINPKITPKMTMVDYFKHVSSMEPDMVTRMMEAGQLHEVLPSLKKVKAHTLIIAGEDDAFTPLSRSLELNQSLPNSFLRVLPNATHSAPVELPDIIWSECERFFKSLKLI